MNERYAFLRVPLDADKPPTPPPPLPTEPEPITVTVSGWQARRIHHLSQSADRDRQPLTIWLIEIALAVLDGDDMQHKPLRELEAWRDAKRERNRTK